MIAKSYRLLMALVLCLTLVPGTYAKEHGRHSDRDDRDRNNGQYNDRDDHDRGNGQHNDRDDHDRAKARHADRDHDRDDDDDAKRISHGKKKGWKGCDVPPGQVKKLGCHPHNTRHLAHYRDRDHDRDRHISKVKPPQSSASSTSSNKTTTKAPAQTRRNRKVYNDDGTWRSGGSGQPTTTASNK